MPRDEQIGGGMPGGNRFASLLRSPRAIPLIAALAVIVYVAWIGGPYLRSIVIRDAAITSWITVAHTPINGRVDMEALVAGSRVGSDGRITGIVDERLASVPLAVARAELDRAKLTLDISASKIATLQATVAERQKVVDDFIALFVADLELEIANLQPRIQALRDALKLEIAEAERLSRLRDSGVSSQSEADLAAVAVIDRRRSLTDTESTLSRSEIRLAAARNGVLMIFDGSDAGFAIRSLQDATDQLTAAKAEHAEAETQLAVRRAAFEAIERAYDSDRVATIQAPPGAMVWSLVAGPGTEVSAGMPIASWVDCRIMLVDAPVSDLEAALLRPGVRAEVTIEGERERRSGTVLFTRGAAATLALDDLAAVAKGRNAGVGQALIELAPEDDDLTRCPIGHAAYVDFPDVGLIDMVRARLRM